MSGEHKRRQGREREREGERERGRERGGLTPCRSCATASASRIAASAPRSALRSACASRISRPASPAAAAIATNRLASAFFSRVFFLRARSLASLRALAASANDGGERAGGGAHTGVCGLAHNGASRDAPLQAKVDPGSAARARISQLGSISESSDRAGLMR